MVKTVRVDFRFINSDSILSLIIEEKDASETYICNQFE